ncbi:DUF1460 domain-containing protein [candidate division KSB1 bacterium]|nr:DUF1460 domain-containing protein [candidate division KSB1 bacterium]
MVDFRVNAWKRKRITLKRKDMKHLFYTLSILVLIFLINSCGVFQPAWKEIQLSEEELKTIELLKIDDEQIRKLEAKPIYKFTEKELDLYLGYLQFIEPDLRQRIQHLGRKCIGQPYEIYLMGEYPVEIFDPQPLISLQKSDCVVFSEHIYAMALAFDWKSFFGMLQRIRYKNGIISLVTRNHYTELDWNRNNSWLLEDITEQIGGDYSVTVNSFYDKSNFFKKWGLGRQLPKDTLEWAYIPHQHVEKVIGELKPGDFVNIVRGNDEGKWVGHVGLITKGKNGDVNFLHSARPEVREQPLLEYMQESLELNEKRKEKNKKIAEHNSKIQAGQSVEKLKTPLPYFYGFKFLKLRQDPLWELIKIDGMRAPNVTIPSIY